MGRTRCIWLLLLLASSSLAQNVVPKDGYVPDAATAREIAEAVLKPVYGKALIESERPFTAILEGGVWVVSGTIPCAKSGCEGGVATVKIRKADGRIVGMIHGK
ncbi:NTF2 fold immunity protein [Granulicella rosea]|uniref:NTF2 fold immunity protein n=1 Tax=Granulicella rosea TaxID=474952 RepID=A0A239H070_9BACT|nr:NTF2 fold immunity protein [Granulicella rosea]SNS74448.1 NTF2 fold immunity protein [Granulicella rosea]